MKKNDCIEIDITDISSGGEGIGHYEGMTFFVRDAVVGDRILARITKIKKNYGYARVEEMIYPSTFRVMPKCPVAGPCGGCQLQAMDYSEQLAWKDRMVRSRLMRIGGFEEELLDQIMEPVIGFPDEAYGYRNKASYPVRRGREGETLIGFYAPHSHRIVETERCYLGSKSFDRAIALIRKVREVVPYDEETGEGLLRHILLREGHASGELMVCFVVNEEGPAPRLQIMTDALLQALLSPESGLRFNSCCVNYNTTRGNVILGARTDVIYGKPYIEDSMDGLRFHISAPSFYQVNTRQAERIYRKVIEYAGLTGKETVWDLYCGIGTISLYLAGRARQVCGVEVVPEAIENARANAKLNGIENVQFYLGKAEEVLPEYEADVIVVDPPRKGCDARCIETMLQMQPDRIVYVSCDPATLARDLRLLCDGGYTLERGCAADQFCQSVHVECVTMLQRRDM